MCNLKRHAKTTANLNGTLQELAHVIVTNVIYMLTRQRGSMCCASVIYSCPINYKCMRLSGNNSQGMKTAIFGHR